MRCASPEPTVPAVRLPPPVRPGDRVGVAALSGPVDPERLARGLGALAGLGFEPVPASNLAARTGFLAGPDDERLSAFHALAGDPTISAIFFARGGHGVLRVLDRIDWRLLAARPRAYLGYSDLTPLLGEIPRRLGFASFHGPLVAAEFERGLDAEEADSLLGALAGDYPAEQRLGERLRAGVATGPLAGGCLSLLAATLGTPYEPALDGAILVLEDVGEAPYRIDRLLTQLRLAGVFDRIAGLVVGHLDDGGARRPDPTVWRDLVLDAVGGFSWPLAIGHNIGHARPNWTLPLGLPARLDAEAGRLILGAL